MATTIEGGEKKKTGIILNNLLIKAACAEAKKSKKEVWLTEAGGRGEGRMRLRAFPNGEHVFYYRYSLDGVQKQLRIDKEDLAEARDKASRLADLYRAGHRDLHGYLAQTRAIEDAAREAAARELEAKARQGTLAQLLADYIADLDRRGKSSAKDVRGAFRLDVLTAFPSMAAKPAKEITSGDITRMLRHCLTRPVASKGRGKRLTPASASNNKLRQAAKLRAYLQAAFGFGLTADNDALRADGEVLFGLSFNPVANTKTIEGADRAETWALTKDELRQVLMAIEGLPERRRSIAKSMLYLAGQRVQMLCRVTWADLYDDGEHGPVLQMMDLKGGKGTPPRAHLIPMTERLGEVMAPLLALCGTDAPGPFTLRGKAPATSGTLQKIFAELGDQLAAVGKTRRFTWLNMRCTVETHLAALGVNQERRAWLLSHGRTGVQAKHYDRYSYLPEKRQDLDKWTRYLDQLASGEARTNVVQLHAEA
ncbi:tyrosine-type recombinase/integrase [Pseudomonas sp. R-28-1W-6]|uniref:integrase family protein n=1 Tax=Pseudomonas sp. R-28-1W-6 TaxID=2650101 RepID=UPI0013660319|nr:integrase family protein [Pseudomonas sp. R-28-1W-6]MWV11158.1 tyrosine-type recombinase/integrase [Pseudomonas sp. R-28-1W-6]